MKFNDLLRPQFALLSFIVALLVYIIVLDKEGAFQKKFLHFGPSSDTKFFNIQLKTWPQVISVYIIAFFSALSLSYYQNIASFYLNNVLLNPAYKKTINHSKFWSKILGIADPIINAVMAAINFFVTLTMEFQFIFFQLLGTISISIPSNLFTISKKKFTLA
jgi:hypothetical protein